ncbi:MAG: hypothetical protein U0169_17770 [Polyangiaceae bacterium]
MRTKSELTGDLKAMLRDVLAAKAAGQSYGRLSRSHGYIDGFMRALIDLDVVSKDELLEIVRSERERAGGPSVFTYDPMAPAGDDRTRAA